jgi:hypothetical protein
MIFKRLKRHKVAQPMFDGGDIRLEIVGAPFEPFLAYKLTLVFNGCKEISWFSEDIMELLPAGEYFFSPFTAYYICAPYRVKVLNIGAVSPEKNIMRKTHISISYPKKPNP